MSHAVSLVMLADQILHLGTHDINVHDIEVIEVDGTGLILAVMLTNRQRIVRDDYSRSVSISVR